MSATYKRLIRDCYKLLAPLQNKLTQVEFHRVSILSKAKESGKSLVFIRLYQPGNPKVKGNEKLFGACASTPGIQPCRWNLSPKTDY